MTHSRYSINSNSFYFCSFNQLFAPFAFTVNSLKFICLNPALLQKLPEVAGSKGKSHQGLFPVCPYTERACSRAIPWGIRKLKPNQVNEHIHL